MYIKAFIMISISLSYSLKHKLKGYNATCHWKINKSDLKAYWINLDDRKSRSSFMSNQLKEYGLLNDRIEAITPHSPRFNVSKLVKTCKRNTDRDIAVILSHLNAIYTAIHDKSGNKNYAIIFEVTLKL
jgi:hypothetical protein